MAIVATVIALMVVVTVGSWVDGPDLVAETVDGNCGDYLHWEYNGNGTLTITGYGDMYDYAVNTTSVDVIEEKFPPWYEYRASITTVNLPNELMSIGNYAFTNCEALTSINIPGKVTSIGKFAFYDCIELSSSIDIPNGITSIEDYTFYKCEKLSINSIPEGVTSIGNGSFGRCWANTEFKIPESVKSIGNDAFQYCKALKSITIPKDVKSIGKGTFIACTALTSIDIKGEVKSIGDNAFQACQKLKSITIPKYVESIGNSAFAMCTTLESIKIPNDVTSIGKNAFNGCSALKSVVFGSGLTTLGEKPFGSIKFYDEEGETELTTADQLKSSSFTLKERNKMVKAETYTVTYELSGGSWDEETTEYCLKGEDFEIRSTEPTWAGHRFEGWSDGTNGYPAGGQIKNVTGNITLTAQWTEEKTEFTVTYVLGDGVTGEAPQSLRMSEGTEFELAQCDARKEGSVFVGWEYKEETYPAGYRMKMGSENIALTAVWKEEVEEVTITFDPNGGSWSGSSESLKYSCTYGDTIEPATIESPTRESYTFNGWSCDGRTYSAGEKIEVVSDMTFYAVWTANSNPMPVVPILPGDEQDAVEVIGGDEDSENGVDGKTVLLIAIVVAIIAELAVLCISRR